MRSPLAGATVLLATLASEAAAQDQQPPTAADFAGNWMGTLDVGAAQLRLRFVVSVGEDGLGTTLFSLDQGNAGIPVATTAVSADTITMSMPLIGASYQGTLSVEDGRITGTFTQGGVPFPLVLGRASEEDTEVRRPQDPAEPYPYLAEEVTYPNPEGGHTMAGTFTRPADGGPFPAVILISGSGPQDRDESLMGHRPFLVLADHLTRRGVAVLRYDDRGVGRSTGDFTTATTEDFASDALAAVAYLKTRADVDAAAIGLAGHSEGGLVAPMAAVESPDVGFLVLMAATGQSAIFEVLKSEPDPERAGQAIDSIVRKGFQGLSEAERAQAGITTEASMEQAVAAQVRQVNNPWFRYFLTYEPAPMLERVTVPVLALNGEKDLQVHYEENLREIATALERGGNLL